MSAELDISIAMEQDFRYWGLGMSNELKIELRDGK